MESSISELIDSVIIKIKENRKKQGISHENMAFELGISISTYNKIERQETKLTVERLLQILQILKVSLAEVFSIINENVFHQNIKDSGIGQQNLKDNSVNQQTVENLYQDSMNVVENHINSLKEEIQFLRSQLNGK